MLGPFSDYRAVFVEIAQVPEHGGPGWEFGTCLWSPVANRDGADRYSLMREPQAGDLVLHFLRQVWNDGKDESRLSGRSIVLRPAREIRTPPPNAGNWQGFDRYYRVDLDGYQPFEAAVALRTITDTYGPEIRRDLQECRPRFYPFTTHGTTIRTVQGVYLARCTAALFETLRSALGVENANKGELPGAAVVSHEDFAESRRLTRERSFFARNPALVRAARERYGARCSLCGFDFGRVYGALGAGYIEVHHLNPLSERPESDWSQNLRTSLDDVTVLCANCHRVIHRHRPAHTPQELRAALDSTARLSTQ